MPDETIRIASGIPGFRWWLIGHGELRSPWRPALRWEPGPNRAECLYRRRLFGWGASRAPHQLGIPERTCTCGFYGLHRASTTIGFARSPKSWLLDVSCSGGRERLIFGVAAATGRTMVGTQGWRAERAEVRALYLGSDRPCRELGAVEARYGVPVYRDLETMVAEWTGESELEAVA